MTLKGVKLKNYTREAGKNDDSKLTTNNSSSVVGKVGRFFLVLTDEWKQKRTRLTSREVGGRDCNT